MNPYLLRNKYHKEKNKETAFIYDRVSNDYWLQENISYHYLVEDSIKTLAKFIVME